MVPCLVILWYHISNLQQWYAICMYQTCSLSSGIRNCVNAYNKFWTRNAKVSLYLPVKQITIYIGVDFLLINEIPRGAKCFCKAWLNLMILLQCVVLPQIQVKTKKKVFAAFWFYRSSQFWISCCQVGITCQKTKGTRHISSPLVSDPRWRCPPRPPPQNWRLLLYIQCQPMHLLNCAFTQLCTPDHNKQVWIMRIAYHCCKLLM